MGEFTGSEYVDVEGPTPLHISLFRCRSLVKNWFTNCLSLYQQLLVFVRVSYNKFQNGSRQEKDEQSQANA